MALTYDTMELPYRVMDRIKHLIKLLTDVNHSEKTDD